MKLNFLGTGAAYYPALGSTSAWFTLGGSLYLIDCGETTFSRLYSRRELSTCGSIHVLLTHLHADHFGSLGSFTSYCKNVLRKVVTIVTPDKTIARVLALTGLTAQDYTLCTDFSRPFPGGLTVTPVMVRHDPTMNCYGYYLCDGSETIYYGGDAQGMPDGVLEQLRSGALCRVYQEVTYEHGAHPGHTSLEQLCALVPENLRSRTVCMHFGGDYTGKALSCGFDVARA